LRSVDAGNREVELSIFGKAATEMLDPTTIDPSWYFVKGLHWCKAHFLLCVHGGATSLANWLAPPVVPVTSCIDLRMRRRD
jgi:hypothetical protein